MNFDEVRDLEINLTSISSAATQTRTNKTGSKNFSITTQSLAEKYDGVKRFLKHFWSNMKISKLEVVRGDPVLILIF